MAAAPPVCYRNKANDRLIGIKISTAKRKGVITHIFKYVTVDKDDNKIPGNEYQMNEYNLNEWKNIDDPALCSRLFPESPSDWPLVPGVFPPRPKLGGGYRRRRRTHRRRHIRRRGTRARKH
jgi:hypothetical protein